MNAATRRAATVALVVLLLASPVQAWVDPVEAGLLARIAAVMQAIEQFRIRVMATIHEQIYVRINAYAFPRPLLDTINVAITEVSDVRRELQRMACDWPMSFRTRSLSDLFWEKTQFCRGNYQAVWGSHEGFWDGPLQEVNDYFATMTGNMISERSEKTNTSWVQAHKSLFAEHAILRTSPAEANRAEAASLAFANEVAIGNSQIATQDLLIRQMDRALERFDQKKATDLTYYTYRGLRTLDGGSWVGPPPDPSEDMQ